MIQALPEGVILGEARQPPDESNIGQSALFLPISAISEEHRGRKIRTLGQVLAFDVKACLVTLASQGRGSGPVKTIVADLRIPLLDCPNPAITDIPLHDNAFTPAAALPHAQGLVNREKLKLSRGGWVSVVGWLEGQSSNASQTFSPLVNYAPPLDMVLEAIHISNALPPPIDVVYRGDIPNPTSPAEDTSLVTPRPVKRQSRHHPNGKA